VSEPPSAGARPPGWELRADCARCSGLCCVAPAFGRSAEFAFDKPAGVPCLHLADDDRCTIHDRLIPSGFPGCVSFDCFGAGQRLTQGTFGGRDRRTDPDVAAAVLTAFPVMRGLHELLWYLHETLTWTVPDAVRREVAALLDDIEAAVASAAAELVATDVVALQGRAASLLLIASDAVRSGLDGPDLAGADLVGADLREQELSGGCLRGALLIGADLRGVDLRLVDLRGADLRAAGLGGALLAGALCVTRTQLGSAHGDATTTVPSALERPPHWG
jgi:hypothetical protein